MYTCPMHPEIRQDHPGTCPKCGMALWAGWPFFERGAQSMIKRSPNMWTLISIGTGAAFLYSVVATVVPNLFPAAFQSMGRVAVYFEAAAVIISITFLGKFLN